MNSLCQDAQRVSLMFQFGLIRGQAVVDWADSQIIALDSPPPTLIELSTTPISRTADLLSHLGALASGADYWEAFRMVLGLFYQRVASHPERTGRLASELYSRLVSTWPRMVPDETPMDLQFLYEFDLALEVAEVHGN